MEIELKYSLSNRKEADAIWNGRRLAEYADEDTREIKNFKAVYYDTADFDLLAQDIAYRIRMEGDKLVAAIKWNGKNVGPLHRREELNINLGKGGDLNVPNPKLFGESEIGKELLEIIGDKPLKKIMEVNVERRSVKFDVEDAIFELSLDEGEILAGGGREAVCELEVELYSGPDEAIKTVEAYVKEDTGYDPEDLSKFARGLKLLGKI